MNGRESARWKAATAMVPMTKSAADVLPLQYAGEAQNLETAIKSANANATFVVIPMGVDAAARVSLAMACVQSAGATDVVGMRIYAATPTMYTSGNPGVLLERLAVATLTANGDAMIDGVGVDVGVTPVYYAKSISLTSDGKAEARTKVAIDAADDQSPGTIELTDPGECAALVVVIHAPASGVAPSTAQLLWRTWQ